jgi:hypothetical protein
MLYQLNQLKRRCSLRNLCNRIPTSQGKNPPALQYHVPVSKPQLQGLLSQPPTIEIPESPDMGSVLQFTQLHLYSSFRGQILDLLQSHKRKATTLLEGQSENTPAKSAAMLLAEELVDGHFLKRLPRLQ